MCCTQEHVLEPIRHRWDISVNQSGGFPAPESGKAKAHDIGMRRSERRQDELEQTLTAIARAIVAGKLTPDDAFAWARIAVCEVVATTSSSCRNVA